MPYSTTKHTDFLKEVDWFKVIFTHIYVPKHPKMLCYVMFLAARGHRLQQFKQRPLVMLKCHEVTKGDGKHK